MNHLRRGSRYDMINKLSCEYIKVYDWMWKISTNKACTMICAIITAYKEHHEECCVSYKELAYMLGVSRRTTIRAVKELEEKGYIKVTRDTSKVSGTLRNVYEIIKEGEHDD